MKKLVEIDKNFTVETKLDADDLVFYNVKDKPFDLYGFYSAEKGKPFERLPKEVAEKTSENVSFLNSFSAGGRVRFKTDSPYVAVSVKYNVFWNMNHMPISGSAGVDMYVFENQKYTYVKTFIPPVEVQDNCFEGIYYFETNALKDITINFPLYSSVEELYVGVADGSTLTGGGKYKNEKPIVYYGSSITQGGCASTPGNSYQGIVSRHFNYDYINLGFSGGARGEESIGKYIADLELSCFVCDYDHNAPDVEHLKKTHSKLFNLVRNNHPDVPIVILSSIPIATWSDEVQTERKDAIRTTYLNARAQGDENVYFIEGDRMFDLFENVNCTVDGTHPTDLGFACMANAIIKTMEKICIE